MNDFEITKKYLDEYKIKYDVRPNTNIINIIRGGDTLVMKNDNWYRTKFNNKGMMTYYANTIFEEKRMKTLINKIDINVLVGEK